MEEKQAFEEIGLGQQEWFAKNLIRKFLIPWEDEAGVREAVGRIGAKDYPYLKKLYYDCYVNDIDLAMKKDAYREFTRRLAALDFPFAGKRRRK